MIAIFSKNEYERSTENVMDWLKYSGGNFIRINGTEFNESIKCFNFNSLFEEIPIDKINICWLRRWFSNPVDGDVNDPSVMSNYNTYILSSALLQEKKTISGFLWYLLKDKKWLTFPHEIRISKLEVLFEAKKIGIEIPETIITTSKESLLKFKHAHKRIISKNITECISIQNEDEVYVSMTEEICDELINKISNIFFPSLFQELIEKEYEIRTFFLDNKFYSMAIFSQYDRQTKIDFRHYNSKNPNRTIPYNLPSLVEEKLKKLIINLGYTTGSIDFIKSTSGKYIFLEFNPVGQYGMISFPCNYYLDKKVAKFLNKNDN